MHQQHKPNCSGCPICSVKHRSWLSETFEQTAARLKTMNRDLIRTMSAGGQMRAAQERYAPPDPYAAARMLDSHETYTPNANAFAAPDPYASGVARMRKENR